MAWKIRGMAFSQPPPSTHTRTLLPAHSWPLAAPVVFLSLRVRAVPAVPVGHSHLSPLPHPGARDCCVPRSAWLHVEQVVRGAKRVQKPLGGMKCGRGCPWPQKRPFPECASQQLQAQGPSGGWVPSDPAASSCMGFPSPQADP